MREASGIRAAPDSLYAFPPMAGRSPPASIGTTKEADMSTVSHEPSTVARRRTWIDARDMWASLTIVAIWLAVAVSAAFGPDLKSFDVSGSNTTIPSAILVALFAMFATMSIAKHGFDPKERIPKR
jgi:hypothetical protein